MRVHPPDLAFANDIAETNKQAAVPFIVKRLRTEKDEAFQCHLLYVLERMGAPYGVTFDGETVQAAAEVVGRMKYDAFRTRGEKSLAVIRSAAEKPSADPMPPRH